MNIRSGEYAKKGVRIAMFWFLVMIVVTVDQATKAAAIEVLEHGPLTVIPGVIDFVLVRNTGAAFSFGEGAGVVFILIAIAFLVGAVIAVVNSDDMPFGMVASIAFVAGGGVGNMVDRILMGSVTDFIKTTFMDFPVFNVADICVTLGVVACMVFLITSKPAEESEATAAVDKSEA
ncbi:MAG: signal peptidase II [Atopobiaceae bacterium]|nr:signal peptidase II [Atopobiaceae bacterium]